MPLIDLRKINYVTKKISLEEEISKELKEYIKFLGLEEEKEEKAESDVVNKALQYVFRNDKDYKKYKDSKKKSKASQDASENPNESTN